MLNKSPMSDTLLHTLYNAESHGLELSYEVLDARDYIQWFVSINYARHGSLFQ